MNIAEKVGGLSALLESCKAGFEVTQVPSAESQDWCLSDGALQHSSGGFFSVNGYKAQGSEALLLFQPQAAVTGLLMARQGGDPYYLLQARAEPGCLGEAQFGPTVQSTPANFLRMHGGRSTPYVNAFVQHSLGTSILQDTSQLDLGGRYFLKTKRSIFAEAGLVATSPAFVWASPDAVRAGLRRSAFFNVDLRSIFAVMPWTEDGCGFSPSSDLVRNSLAAPIRTDEIGHLMELAHRTKQKPLLSCDLSELSNWRETDWGWSEDVPRQGFAIHFYKVRAAHREVEEWVQPLVDSASEGEALLACRERGGFLECFVRATPEVGLAVGAGLSPSYLRYPGTREPFPSWVSGNDTRIWLETKESDEGGRFFRDVSRYGLIWVGGGAVPRERDGAWLRVSELKMLLSMSNTCTIQLRGLASLLLCAEDSILGFGADLHSE